MRLHGPHIGVQRVLVQAIAIGLALSLQHQVVEFLDGELALPASLKEALLEEEPAGDIYDNLAGTLQRGFQDSDFLLPPGLLQGRVTDDRLTEDPAGFFPDPWHRT